MRIGRILLEPGAGHRRLGVHLGSSAPESVTGPVRAQNPSHLIIVDAAHLGMEPGAITLVERADIAGISFCTHALPLPVIVDYLVTSLPELDVLFLGIQPAEMGFDEPLTPVVEASAQAVAQSLVAALNAPASLA
jgi:hydrogenase 3 maturation protease